MRDHIHIGISPEMMKQLNTTVKQTKRPKSDLIRQAISQFLKSNNTKSSMKWAKNITRDHLILRYLNTCHHGNLLTRGIGETLSDNEITKYASLIAEDNLPVSKENAYRAFYDRHILEGIIVGFYMGKEFLHCEITDSGHSVDVQISLLKALLRLPVILFYRWYDDCIKLYQKKGYTNCVKTMREDIKSLRNLELAMPSEEEYHFNTLLRISAYIGKGKSQDLNEYVSKWLNMINIMTKRQKGQSK